MSSNLFLVELKGLPLEVHRRAEEHNLVLRRELTLIHAADRDGTAPARLLWLSQELSVRYAAFSSGPQEVLQAAIDSQREVVDLRYEVPADAADAAEQLGMALDEVDDYCRAGEMLTLVAPKEAQAYRRWFLGEFVAQMRHRAGPTPWNETTWITGGAMSPRAGVTQQATTGTGRTSTIVVADDLDLQGSAMIRGQLAALLNDGIARLVLDLTGCQFIDSVGVSLLLTTRQRLQDRDGTLLITNASGLARRTLEISGIYDVLTSEI